MLQLPLRLDPFDILGSLRQTSIVAMSRTWGSSVFLVLQFAPSWRVSGLPLKGWGALVRTATSNIRLPLPKGVGRSFGPIAQGSMADRACSWSPSGWRARMSTRLVPERSDYFLQIVRRVLHPLHRNIASMKVIVLSGFSTRWRTKTK